jgi:SpoVK/Ycf46/Vps4 family AAA+-type ATPase
MTRKSNDNEELRCPKCGKVLRPRSRFDNEREFMDFDLYTHEHLDPQECFGDHFSHGKGNTSDLFFMVKPEYSLDDVVLSESNRRALEGVIAELENHKLVHEKWGFGETLKMKKGMTLLFVGPSGTGKTMTAEALSNHLKKKIMIVNYARLENLWLGETEKNIVHAFKEAKNDGAVLFFDEVDAILQKRGSMIEPYEVRHVNVLLTQLERYDGLVILATNMSALLDKALERRVDVAIEFETPDAEMRQRIYRKIVPKKAPLRKVDFEALSKKYPLTGGEILNVVRGAMRNALIRKSKRIGMDDFIMAAEEEVAKSSKLNSFKLKQGDKEKRISIKGYA